MWKPASLSWPRGRIELFLSVLNGSNGVKLHHMDIVNLPDQAKRLIAGFSVEEITVGQSGDRVFRLEDTEGVRFLKMSTVRGYADLREEYETLTWLASLRFPFAPRPFHFLSIPSQDFLLLEAVIGRNLDDGVLSDAVIGECARMLRQVHELPTKHCPHNRGLAQHITAARLRIADGLVDESDFDNERVGWSAQQVLDEVLRTKPSSEDTVFSHGDFTPANILFSRSRPSGLVDWGRAGRADRYCDLSLFCRSLPDPRSQERFLAAYGIEQPDRGRLSFYRLLDELF